MTYKIMIVEDDPDIAQLLSLHLQKFGFCTYLCKDFSGVLEEFEKIAPHLVLLDIAAPVALPVFYLVVVGQAVELAWLYYCFLSLFVLLCFLLYRFYATWNLYELFCKEQAEMEDFLLYAPKGREECNYQRLMLAFYRRYLAKLNGMEDARKQNKLMIYRWVHQLKTPLSVIQLIAQKNGYQADYKKISQSAAQIQYHLDQVLNMYKLDAMENDFHVERIFLRQIAKDSINELKSSFIARGIFPKLDAEEHLMVCSDSNMKINTNWHCFFIR